LFLEENPSSDVARWESPVVLKLLVVSRNPAPPSLL